MTVFVTGGSGFVGGALVARFLETGAEVRALARSREVAAGLEAIGAVPVLGDVLGGDDLRPAMEGCATVFHVAGVNESCPRDPAGMYRVNVDGTRSVVAAAAGAGVARVVVTSSAAAIGEPAGVLADEQTPHSGSFLSHYARSKKLGEDAAFEEGARRGVAVVAVNPSSVQGPGRTTGSARLLLRVLGSRRPLLVGTTLSLVDIADCTQGHLLAAEHGRPGERYLLSGATLSTADLVALAAEAAGIRLRPRYLPRRVVATAGIPAAAGIRLMVRDAEVCPELVRTLVHGHRFDGSKAVRSLGLRYTPIAETVRRTVAWYRQQGLLPPH